jgi:hypothetical protein
MDETSMTVNGGAAAGDQEPKPAEPPFIKGRDHRDPKARVNILGKWYAEEEVEQVHRQNAEREAAYLREQRERWAQTPQGKLCLELYRKFQEYQKYLAEHPCADERPDGAKLHLEKATFPEHMLFADALEDVKDYEQERAEKDIRNLQLAQQAARCEHRYLDGEGCRAPRVRGKTLCRMHQGMEEARAVKLDLGSMEDPDSIQVAIMKLQRAVIDGTLDSGQIGRLAYLIQLAAWNVTRTTFGNRPLPEYTAGNEAETETC